MTALIGFQPGSLVKARGREWVVLPESDGDLLHLRPLGGGGEDKTVLLASLERSPIEIACFPPPNPESAGSQAAGLLLRDAMMLRLRAGAGPFRCFGNITVEPRAYQLVPLLMALRQPIIRLLIADDVGIGKTIEAGLIARELIDRGEILHTTVLCPPHLCEQWQEELWSRFNIEAVIVRTTTAGRLERGLPAGKSIFEAYPFTIVSLDYIKSSWRRDEFQRACPDFVIVDEAHTCTQGAGMGRHQRYALLKGLAEDKERHMVLLTATPHSGNDDAFYNLLGLLDKRFHRLQDALGDERNRLRETLSHHFVQRRRPDIEEWQAATLFPERFTRESTYRLTGPWGQLFNDVLEYARELVESTEGASARKQRMSWWAALALLRCISSSPAAAVQALRTRIVAEEQGAENDELEEMAANTVLDGEGDDALSFDDNVPGVLTTDNAVYLGVMLEQAKDLFGTTSDPKLKKLITEIQEIVDQGFQPVVFCRYIATAHYVAEYLANSFPDHGIAAVTGELMPAEREQKVHSLGEFGRRILVATDCLSEGINLQGLFDTVVHYDLSWNPTRHEQRDGRVDRFGQPAKQVRTIMLYGEDNPVDGAVLRVILRKAERIRKELGVLIPMPEDSNRITQAIMQAVLMRGREQPTHPRQADIFEGLADIDDRVEREWESAREKAEQNRTIFAQRRLKPDDVLPEFHKAFNVLGSEKDVQRFVTHAAERLGAPLESYRGCYKFPLRHLPPALKERLGLDSSGESLTIDFRYPPAAASEYLSRTHPLVSHLAEFISEQALDGESVALASRCGAIFTNAVTTKTTLYLLRCRSQLTISRGSYSRTLLAEEALPIAILSATESQSIVGADALALMQAEPDCNMEPAVRIRHVRRSLDSLEQIQPRLDDLARQRAEELLADHRRVRDASEARGTYKVTPMLPVDVIGIFVLVPVQKF